MQTSLGAFAQNEIEWAPWLRTLAGVRVDGYRFGVEASEPANSGTEYASTSSPKAGVVLGPWKGTELYANVGYGFHSNDARGATITVDPVTGEPADRVTPLARATGAEVGLRTVRMKGPAEHRRGVDAGRSNPSCCLWATQAPPRRAAPAVAYGIEWANYYTPTPWLVVDGDVSVSRGAFHRRRPGRHSHPRRGRDRCLGRRDRQSASARCLAACGGGTSDRGRWSRTTPCAPLDEPGEPRGGLSAVTLRPAGARRLQRAQRPPQRRGLLLHVAAPGEPIGGIDDVHFHATLPRTARLNLIVGF